MISESTNAAGDGELVSVEELLYESPAYEAVPTTLLPDTELSYVILDLDLDELAREMHRQILWFGDEPEEIERLIELYNLDHVPNYAPVLVETASLLTDGKVSSVVESQFAGRDECLATIQLLYLGMLEVNALYGGGITLYSVGRQTRDESMRSSEFGERPGLVQVYRGLVPYIVSGRLVVPTFGLYLEEAAQYLGCQG